MSETSIREEVEDLLKTCPRCKGTGDDPFSDLSDCCQHCGGSGVRLKMGPLIPELLDALRRAELADEMLEMLRSVDRALETHQANAKICQTKVKELIDRGEQLNG